VRIQSKPYTKEAKQMPLNFVRDQSAGTVSSSTPYDVASHFAYSKGFKTLKEYTDYVTVNNLTGFLPDPTKYRGYTTAWNFLGTSRKQYYSNRGVIMASKRDRAEVARKTRETKARRKAERELAQKSLDLNANTTQQPVAFSAEQVVDILVKSDASSTYIAQFIQEHKVDSVYAVAILIDLLKSKTQVAITL